jgi:hypothetical protein
MGNPGRLVRSDLIILSKNAGQLFPIFMFNSLKPEPTGRLPQVILSGPRIRKAPG